MNNFLPQTAAVYFVAQLLGSFLGYGLLRAVTPVSIGLNLDDNFCVSAPAVPTFEALCVEFIITSILILVCCGVWDPRNANHHGKLSF